MNPLSLKSVKGTDNLRGNELWSRFFFFLVSFSLSLPESSTVTSMECLNWNMACHHSTARHHERVRCIHRLNR